MVITVVDATSDTRAKTHHRTRLTICLVAAILLGLTFLMSGSGKIIGFGEMPGQTIKFLHVVIPAPLLTPAVAAFIGDVFLPYIIPWIELCLGVILLLGIWPRLIAIIGLLLSTAFMVSNSWLISQGMEKFSSCECFGIWEEIFGTLTPLQSLCVDIGLFALALTIILLHPGGFLASPAWAVKLDKRRQAAKQPRGTS